MFRMKLCGGKTIVLIYLLVAFSLFFYGPGLAASGSAPADRSADLRDLLYRFINFALLVIILIWALKKRI